MVLLTLFLIAILAALIFSLKSFVLIEENETAIVERLGKYNRVLTQGAHFIIPFFETLRGIETPDKKYSISKKICLSPQTMPFPKDDRTFFSKNNEQLKIKCQILYQITDPYKAVYEVTYLFDAINQLIAGMIQKRMIEKEDEIDELRNIVNIFNGIIDIGNEYSLQWGVKIIEFRLKQIIDSNGIRHNIEE